MLATKNNKIPHLFKMRYFVVFRGCGGRSCPTITNYISSLRLPAQAGSKSSKCRWTWLAVSLSLDNAPPFNS